MLIFQHFRLFEKHYIMFTGMDSRKIYFIKGDYVQRTSKKNGTYIR